MAFNDVIVKLDGKAIGSTMDLRKYLYQQKKIGDKIEITYYRGGKEQTVALKLEDKGTEE
ncbi:Serine protease Do-like HtrB [compost metagenome]